jgi:GMP reductase
MKYYLEEIKSINISDANNKLVYDIEVEEDNSFTLEDKTIVHNSACTTRFLTGCGLPQFSAILSNSYIAHGQQSKPRHIGLICSDGGHKNPGDVCKGFCGGADFVMLGGYWAGADECVGKWELLDTFASIDPNNKAKSSHFSYYGMSTHHAQELYEDTKKDYRASEGTKITVKVKGPIQTLINELLGGIRSCCCYIGATAIKDMSKCASFCRVNQIHQNKNPQLGV